jgi:hypothetical protein
MNRQHLEKVAEQCGIFKRVGAVAPKKPYAVGPDLFYRDLTPRASGMVCAPDNVCTSVRRKSLDHPGKPARSQIRAQRKENIQHCFHEVAPKIAISAAAPPDKAA